MKLTIEDLETWRGRPVTIARRDGTNVTGEYTATIPAEPFGRARAARRDRVVVRRNGCVTYVRVDEIAEIAADGRRRPRAA